ncbi:MAG: dihydropteroate synthase [Porphyromonadaceae bacterium]|nr:dihydropteroate synthase [Porphyromonadaceae bacterium]
MQKRTLNLGGKLYGLDIPLVMGIVNATPDSFFSDSRAQGEALLSQRIAQLVGDGADIIDVGGYSSRPGATDISPREERGRLEPALRLLRDNYPGIPVSVDTFRADVAAWARDEYGVAMINDISAGTLDEAMFETVARRQIPYIMMHMRGTPKTMNSLVCYESLTVEVLDYFVDRLGRLRDLGLHDVVIDPGFGFAKTLEQNYELLNAMADLKDALELPLLVGVSRKSMIYRFLGVTADEALNGTTVLHTYALLSGADVLRVHDVREAREVISLVQKIKEHRSDPVNKVEYWVR